MGNKWDKYNKDETDQSGADNYKTQGHGDKK